MNTKIQLIVVLIAFALVPGCSRKNPARTAAEAAAAAKEKATIGSGAHVDKNQKTANTAAPADESECGALAMPAGFTKVEGKSNIQKIGQDFRLIQVRGRVEAGNSSSYKATTVWARISYDNKETVEQGLVCSRTSGDGKSEEIAWPNLELNTAMDFSGAEWLMREDIKFIWVAGDKETAITSMDYHREQNGKSLFELFSDAGDRPLPGVFEVYSNEKKSKVIIHYSYTLKDKATKYEMIATYEKI